MSSLCLCTICQHTCFYCHCLNQSLLCHTLHNIGHQGWVFDVKNCFCCDTYQKLVKTCFWQIFYGKTVKNCQKFQCQIICPQIKPNIPLIHNKFDPHVVVLHSSSSDAVSMQTETFALSHIFVWFPRRYKNPKCSQMGSFGLPPLYIFLVISKAVRMIIKWVFSKKAKWETSSRLIQKMCRVVLW